MRQDRLRRHWPKRKVDIPKQRLQEATGAQSADRREPARLVKRSWYGFVYPHFRGLRTVVWNGDVETANVAKAFALIRDDPDAPLSTRLHWLIYDLSADVTRLAERVPTQEGLPNGAKQGVNDFKKVGYGGALPAGTGVPLFL